MLTIHEQIRLSVDAAEYVRTRRLSEAALDPADSRDTILGVVVRYGCEGPETSTPAFKKEFWFPPGHARTGTHRWSGTAGSTS